MFRKRVRDDFDIANGKRPKFTILGGNPQTYAKDTSDIKTGPVIVSQPSLAGRSSVPPLAGIVNKEKQPEKKSGFFGWLSNAWNSVKDTWSNKVSPWLKTGGGWLQKLGNMAGPYLGPVGPALTALGTGAEALGSASDLGEGRQAVSNIYNAGKDVYQSLPEARDRARQVFQENWNKLRS